MIGYGSAKDCLRIATQALPEPQGAEVLIKLKAASINPLDIWMRHGYGKTLFETQRKPPIVLGRDFSGVVVDVGPRVWNFKVTIQIHCTKWKPGDEVYGGIWPLHQGILFLNNRNKL